MNADRPRQPSAGHIPQKAKKAVAEPKESLPPIEDEEVQAMLDQIEQQRKELEEALSRVLDSLKMSKSEFDRLLSDPKNFTAEEWKEMESAKGQFKEKIVNLMGKEGVALFEKKVIDKIAKAQRSKSIGARKKWIPM